MDVEHLVHMANQIGQFFQAQPDRAEALDGIATHIRKFWAPRMRHALARHIEARAEGGAEDGLLPIVRDALQVRADVLD
ncbi:formate dehydrogenase subunit delta [Ideonella azotifigens]|uniref:Formate dehydrogenase subunit delta n=1 Tax=Ideonella azotifigens TaxID=513160 RepID=A0ABN1K5D7_9BURK|nr:formate dehydrogenase subunit delta [Ideonella azotifigens]MCD2342384.1 formate dehydrogenase subunit delta [Ideonella azotifigens]